MKTPEQIEEEMADRARRKRVFEVGVLNDARWRLECAGILMEHGRTYLAKELREKVDKAMKNITEADAVLRMIGA